MCSRCAAPSYAYQEAEHCSECSEGKAQRPAQLVQCTTADLIGIDPSRHILVLCANNSTGDVPYVMNCSMTTLNLHLEV